jgi:hypothetical protein
MGALTQQGRRVGAPGATGGVLNQTRAPLEAPMNAATSRFGGAVEEAGNVWNTRAIQFQQEQNAVEVAKRIAELDQIKRDRVDPLLQLEGSQALEREGFERGVIDEADKIYSDAYDEIRSKLESPDQMRRFDVRYESKRNEGMNEVAGHYSKQHQVVKKAAFDAGYSEATISIRKNWFDMGHLENKIAEVKEDYNELHPGTNNGAVTDKVEQEMRVEYLTELLVMAPKAAGPILTKWTDEGKIPASVAETIRNKARTEDEKQESNKLAAAALEIQANTGSDKEAAEFIRSKATTPEVAARANALFSGQVELERRIKLQQEKDFADDKNAEFMGMWVEAPDKLTPDVILNSGLKPDQVNWWLTKLTAGDSPTSMAMKGDLLARAYEAPDTKPIESWEELMSYTMPDPSRPGKTLSMKDAQDIWKLKLYNDRQMRLGLARDIEQLEAYSRSKAGQEGVAMLKGFAAQRQGGLDDDNINETIGNFHAWISLNPKATGPEITAKAKELGKGAILDRNWWKNNAPATLGGQRPDVYPKDVLGEEVGAPGARVPYTDVVKAWPEEVRSKVDLIFQDMRKRQPHVAIPDDDMVRYKIYEELTKDDPDGLDNYKIGGQ